MKTVLLKCANGFTWKTSANGTDEEIKAYFIGNRFETMPYNEEGEEALSECVECVIEST